jgi:hypothetical protein
MLLTGKQLRRFYQMITKEDALKLSYGSRLYFLDKTESRVLECRVSGKVKTWKTRPNDWYAPVKYGLYENAHIGTGGENPERFYLTREEVEIFLPPQIKGRIATKKNIKSLNSLLTL